VAKLSAAIGSGHVLVKMPLAARYLFVELNAMLSCDVFGVVPRYDQVECLLLTRA